MERAVLMAHGDAIRTVDLGLRAAGQSAPRYEDMALDDVEQILIRKALARHGNNVSHAAKALGLSRSALYRRMEQFRIDPGNAG